jgi:hypothetical protein
MAVYKESGGTLRLTEAWSKTMWLQRMSKKGLPGGRPTARLVQSLCCWERMQPPLGTMMSRSRARAKRYSKFITVVLAALCTCVV